MEIKTIITIAIIYILVGLYIHWVTEPALELQFKKYKRNDWFIFVIDTFFWPIELLIVLGVYLFKKSRALWNR